MQNQDTNKDSIGKLFFRKSLQQQSNQNNSRSFYGSQMSLSKPQQDSLQSLLFFGQRKNNIQSTIQTYREVNTLNAFPSLIINDREDIQDTVLQKNKKIKKNKKRQLKKSENSQLQFFEICRQDLDTDKEYIIDEETQSESDSNNNKSFVFINTQEFDNIIKNDSQEKQKSLDFTSDVLDIKNFFQKRKNELKKIYEKIYQCEFCQKKFSKGSSLGGHISTQHPKKSKKFQNRLKSQQNRVIEKQRKDFYKSL